MFNVTEAVEAQKARVARIREVAKRLKALGAEKGKLQSEEDSLLAEVQSFGISTDVTSTPVKAKRGRPRKTEAEKAEKPTGEKRGRATSKTGETRMEILYRVMPGSEDSPVSKEKLTQRVSKTGYDSASAKPEIGIGQDLGKMKAIGHATNNHGERGEWRLTKFGEKARDKQAEERKAAKAEAKEAKAALKAAKPAKVKAEKPAEPQVEAPQVEATVEVPAEPQVEASTEAPQA